MSNLRHKKVLYYGDELIEVVAAGPMLLALVAIDVGGVTFRPGTTRSSIE
jgi:hypothetical protein